MGWLREHAEKHGLNGHAGHLQRPGHSQQTNGGSHGAGANWAPNKPPYDVNSPIYPVCYSEEDKTAQREAGKKLAQDVKDAIGEKRPVLEVPRGVYRISDAECGSGEALMLCDSENFTLRGPGVEIICELEGSHARVLGNKNLTLEGAPNDPLILDSEPLGFTQGHILDSNRDDLTIDFQVMEGYRVPESGGRIQVFGQDGVMLPHTQDPAQEVRDLGGGRFQLKMNDFTWDEALLNGADFFAPGNLIAMEQGGRGGFEVRSNEGLTFRNVVMCCAALVWAMPEKGDDLYERFQGCRRPGTNRLVGGGWPLQTFWHGSFTMIDSEVGHNFDDITDINTPPNWAFGQRSPREFFLHDVDGSPLEDGCELTLYKYPHMELIGKTRTVRHEDKVDDEMQKDFIEICKKINIREAGGPRLYTVDSDIDIGEFCMADTNWKANSMKFINCHMHDGLAGGVQPKGAHEILIENCVVERVNLMGIGAGFDPFWWEGNPSSNIRILNNTVVQCPYGPGVCYPAISVYAGGDDQESSGSVMHDVEVRGNLVIGSLGPGIGVRQASNVVIADNVIVHHPEHDAGYAAIQVDAVTEGTKIVNNTFVNLSRDAWQLPISVGPRTQPSALRLSNNRIQDPNEQLPDTPWQFFFWGMNDCCRFEGDWCQEGEHRYPNDKAWTNRRENKVFFDFEGSEVAVKTMRNQNSGKCDVFLDDQHQGCIDLSRMYGQSCVAFRSQPLQHGRHSLRLEGAGEKGEFSTKDSAIILEGFYVMNEQSGGHCVV